jgi:thioredoxin 1
MKTMIAALILLNIVFGSIAPGQSNKTLKTSLTTDTTAGASQPVVTFIELGSVKCIPCKAMQPVMKAIEAKYGEHVKVLFYDVWKEDQQHYAQKYGIRLIPTQVFLDARGKELMRHEGFFPEKDIDAFLKSKGLKPEADKTN